MTTQYAVLPARSGRSYTAKLFAVSDLTTEITVTSITVTELGAKGLFRAAIVKPAVVASGDYVLIYLYGTVAAAVGYFTFSGTDGETATETPVRAELDSAAQAMVTAFNAMRSGNVFTAPALANAPTGGGGGDAEQATLLEVQDTVDALAISLAGSSITITSRVSGSQITAYIGDDYKVRSGTELEIMVSDTAGALHSKISAIGVGNLRFGASLPRKEPGQVTGTIASLSYSTNVLTIVVEITACASGLSTGDYTYQIQSSQAQSGSYDDYIELEGTLIVKQRTVAAIG